MTGPCWAGVTAAPLVWTVLASTHPLPAHPVLPLHITRAAMTTVASCTLMARGEQPGAVTLYFVTAGRLFRGPDDVHGEPISSVFIDPAGRHLVVRPDDVILPGGTLVDLSILRATVATSDLVAPALSFVPPLLGEPFTINGVGEDGGAVDVPQRVRFASTLFAVGDRDASRLVGCVGAAASTAAGTFGIVTACELRKAPTVTLLAPARGFLERHIRSLQIGRHTS